QADEDRGDERSADGSGHDAAAEQERRGGAGERQLADAVDGEGEVALHDEDADEPADDAEHGARDDGVRQQRHERAVVLEREDVAPVERRGDHACSGWSWCGSASGAPTTTRRSSARSTNTGVPYRSLRTRLCSTSSGLPSTK